MNGVSQQFKELGNLQVPVCLRCKSIEDVRFFEDSIGSRIISLNAGKIAKVFWGAEVDEPETLGYYRGSLGFPLDTSLFAYEIWIRKSIDGLPGQAVCYEFSRPQSHSAYGKEGELNFFIGKVVFDDPVLKDSLLNQNVLHASVDSNFIWALYDTIGARLRAQYPINSLQEHMNRPARNGAFYESDILGVEHFKYTRYVDREGVIHLEAPYESHYNCEYLNPMIDSVGNPIIESLSGMSYCLGWSSSYGHYIREKTINNEKTLSIELDPNDLAIYFMYHFPP